MKLAHAGVPAPVITALKDLNIRDVEAFLSIVATPTGLIGISKALKLSVPQVRRLAMGLKSRYPKIDFVAAGGPFRAMGHVARCQKS